MWYYEHWKPHLTHKKFHIILDFVSISDNYISPFSIDNPSSYLFETLFNKKPIIEYGEPSMMAMEYQFYPDFSDITNAIEYSNQLPSENVYNLVSKRHPRRHKARAERQNGNINLCRKVHTFSELYRMCQRLLMGERNTRRRGLRNYRRQNTRKISMT